MRKHQKPFVQQPSGPPDNRPATAPPGPIPTPDQADASSTEGSTAVPHGFAADETLDPLLVSDPDEASELSDAEEFEPSPLLVWPPPEDEMDEWEVLHLHQSGQTLIEPMKYSPELGRPVPMTPPRTSGAESGTRAVPHAEPRDRGSRQVTGHQAAPGAPTSRDVPSSSSAPPPGFPTARHPAAVPPTAPLAPADYEMPETQVIEPLMLPAIERSIDPRARFGRPSEPSTTPRLSPIAPPPEAGRSDSQPAGPRPAWPDPLGVRPPADPFRPGDPGLPAARAPEDTNPGLMTRILPAPPRADGTRPVPPGPSLRASQADTGRIVRPAVPGRPVAAKPLETPAPPPSLVDTLPTGIKLSSLFAKTATGEPAVQAPVSAGDLVIHRAPAASAESVPFTSPVADVTAPAAGHVARPVQPYRSKGWRLALAMLAVAVIAQLVWLSMRTVEPAAAAVLPATLVVDSSPSGATLLVDGSVVGSTPFRGPVPPGQHQLEVRSGELSRPLAITLQAGTVSSYIVELGPTAPVTPPPTVTTAAIEVRTDPPGARVSIGGVSRGVTPLVVQGLAPGRHQVQLSGPFRPVTRTVTVAGGQQALLVVTPKPTTDRERDEREDRAEAAVRPTGGRGSFSIQAPIVLRVMRNGEFMGTSEDSRIQVPAGTYDITLENDGVGYRESRSVQVAAGRHVAIPIELPQGSLNINARPWAEIFVDGKPVGQTPVAQLALPVGAHEIVFRHPDYPERRQSVLVKVGAPGRSFVDFTR